jgi:hypothetical protein
MTLRIGDLLLQQGVITPSELEEALKYQVIFGGKLGTNLIEMGVLEEEDVTHALSRKFKVPAVDRNEIMQIAPEAIAAIPAELAERYRVLPLLLEGRRLILAMADPANLKAVDEISFRTGLIIRPRVVAEVRLLSALEKYYSIERDRRYIHAALKIEAKKKKQPPTPAPPAAPALPDLAPEETWAIELPETEKLATGEAVPAGLPPALQAAEEEELLELDEADIHEAAPGEEGAGKVDALAEEHAAAMLVEAEDRDEILAAVLGSLAHDFPRCAIFLVRGELAMGWRCAVDRQLMPDFDQLQIPLAEPSVLKTVAEGKSYYLGPMPRSPFNSMMLQEMGGSVPAAALLVPLLMMGRVVGILYADGRGVHLGEKLIELQKLTAKAAMAFEILVLKNKILSL